MYARGMSQRDIARTIEDIYGFEISRETVSTLTDRVIETALEWQNRPLKKFYTFLFVDCLYVSVRKEMETKSCAVYVILGYDVNGVKDILGLWIGEAEGKHYWMQIFDEIKGRGVEDVLFISMDGVSGLEEGARSICKDVVVQRCIVHLIRNSVKYIPSKDYKAFTAQLKKVYGSSSLKAAQAEFERFQQTWSQYPGAKVGIHLPLKHRFKHGAEDILDCVLHIFYIFAVILLQNRLSDCHCFRVSFSSCHKRCTHNPFIPFVLEYRTLHKK